MLAIATLAQDKHPTSPKSAANEFMQIFNGEFGDIIPAPLIVLDTPALTVNIATPILRLQSRVTEALSKVEPLTGNVLDTDAMVGLALSPRQMSAPSITRVVLFKGATQIEPARNLLEQRVYENRLGARTTLGAWGCYTRHRSSTDWTT